MDNSSDDSSDESFHSIIDSIDSSNESFHSIEVKPDPAAAFASMAEDLHKQQVQDERKKTIWEEKRRAWRAKHTSRPVQMNELVDLYTEKNYKEVSETYLKPMTWKVFIKTHLKEIELFILINKNHFGDTNIGAYYNYLKDNFSPMLTKKYGNISGMAYSSRLNQILDDIFYASVLKKYKELPPRQKPPEMTTYIHDVRNKSDKPWYWPAPKPKPNPKNPKNPNTRGPRKEDNTRGSRKEDNTRGSRKEDNDNYYILGLKRGSDYIAIKKAYRMLAKKWHPDKNSAPGAEEQFKKIKNAYDELIVNHGQAMGKKKHKTKKRKKHKTKKTKKKKKNTKNK